MPVFDEGAAFLRRASQLHRVRRVSPLHDHAFKEIAFKPFVDVLELPVELEKLVLGARRPAGGKKESPGFAFVGSAGKPLLRNAEGFEKRTPLLIRGPELRIGRDRIEHDQGARARSSGVPHTSNPITRLARFPLPECSSLAARALSISRSSIFCVTRHFAGSAATLPA